MVAYTASRPLAVWISGLLMGLACTSLSAAADIAADLGKVKAFIARLQGPAAASEYAAVANDVGPVVDELRQADLKRPQLLEVRKLLDTMVGQADQRLDQIEADAHDDEAALESLYRSRVWDDMNFALGAFPYWRAWIDLELAKLEPDAGEKLKALQPAMRGFKAASMQLFRPGLVYGGWLGVGYAELESGHKDRARQIFKKLEEVLAGEPDSPMRKAVSMELRMLEAKGGGAVRSIAQGAAVDGNELVLLKAEAFAILQQMRKSGGRPLEAAMRLKSIIGAGKIDNDLLSNMMTYAQELSGVDIGAYTDLAGAEFAMQYEHWYNAMQKYATFFKEVDPPSGLDLNNYRYRWALAAYKSNIFEPAIDVLTKLLAKPGLSGELDQEGSKLLYAIYAQRERKAGSEINRKALRMAAERFVNKNPHDAAADAARLVIVQTSSNANTALQQMDNMSSGQMKNEVGRTAFQIIARDFSVTVARGKPGEGAALARQGIGAWQKLPPEDKQDQFNFALLLEMRALVDEHPEEVLKALEQIEKKGNSNLDIRRALVWSRLQLYDRMSDSATAVAYIKQLAGVGIPAWQIEYLYPWIKARKDVEQRLELARVVRPAVKDQPEMDRRFAMQIIEDLLVKPDNAAASAEAHAFVKQHPNSGDAWRLLARSSEAFEQPFEADKAWTVITDKAVPTMPIWWEGMMSRIRIRTRSNRPDEACPLLLQTRKQQQYVPASFKDEFAKAQSGAQCATAKAGS